MIASINLNGNHIRTVILHVRRSIHSEGHIAVIPLSCKLPVYIDLRKRHHAVEIKIHPPPAVSLIEREGLSIPAHALPGQLSGIAVFFRVERS